MGALFVVSDPGATLAGMTGEGRYYETDTGRAAVPPREAGRQPPTASRAGQEVVELATPIPVMVWVGQHQTRWHLCEGEALAYMHTQVQVRYRDPHWREAVTWVWANAVTRRGLGEHAPRV